MCTLCALAFGAGCASRGEAPASPGAATPVEAPQEQIVRNVPFEGPIGPSDPPQVPLPPNQQPLDPWVKASLDVLYERPSPQGPEPIPVARPKAVYAVGGSPIDQALPGPTAFAEHVPDFVKTAMPPSTPFSNNMVVLPRGSFRMVAFDYTMNDTKLSRDSLVVEASFTDSEGAEWRVESVAPAKMSPNPVSDPWAGGVVIDSLWHGETGRASPAFPLINHKVGLWAWADVYKNDQRVASSALIHVMLTNNTRRPTDWHYTCYDCTRNPVQQIHLMVPPAAYLPSPGGFLHVMWENSTFIEGTPEEVIARAPRLGKQVPTIELSAVPYLRWDKQEIRVEAGQEYRLIVHNQDPSSFHQFHLHSRPSGGHAHGGPDDPRHEEGGTAGGIGPLWKPDGSHERHGDPPAPEHVFFPLPQGSTWATYVSFAEPGEYEFMCPVTNHYRRGMEGKFIVTASRQGGAQ
jgi:hypothetical protein